MGDPSPIFAGAELNGAEAIGWQFLAATAAGASIWSTHFVAIIAYHAGTPVTFDPLLTIISLLIAMAGSFCGLMVAGTIRTSWSPAVGGALVGLSIATCITLVCWLMLLRARSNGI